MKRSHSFDDTTPVKLKVGYEDDGKLSGDYDHVSNMKDHADITCDRRLEADRRLEKLQLLNGRKKIAPSVLDILESNNRIEQMEIENYTLRKRCKRLENIVTQLLENKGKNDEDEEDIHEEVNGINGRHGQLYENNIHLLKTKYKEPCYLDVSQSPPYHPNDTSKSPPYRSPPPVARGDDPSPPLPPFHHTSHPTMIVTSSTTPEYSETSPISMKRESASPPSTEGGETRISSARHSSQSHSPSSRSPPERMDSEKIKEEEEAIENISPEEMEQRNEMFRATYYAHGKSGNGNSTNPTTSNSNSVSIRRSSLTSETRYPVAVKPTPKKHHYIEHSECPTYERNCHGYESKSRSPELTVAPYYSRYHDYEAKSEQHERKGSEGNGQPPARLVGGGAGGAGYPRERSKSYGGESMTYNNKVSSSQVVYATEKTATEAIRSSKPYVHSRPAGELKNYGTAVNGGQRPLTSVLATDPELSKYSSDFYRKLPPKLHIVESQNENGVTLTWNATSNCDSSLVKTYQLFARELFGHKVGTMKRIGTVDALPLPMSCNIDKLKYNIKYKFAVCAVDVYGRFGKMSNFTGKFELKPKGPILDNEDREAEIEVIV